MTRLDLIASAAAITWAADDRQFVAVADGIDSFHAPKMTFHSRVFALLGDPPGETEHPDKSFNEVSKGIVDDAELAPLVAKNMRNMPGYRFNMQRVDLILE